MTTEPEALAACPFCGPNVAVNTKSTSQFRWWAQCYGGCRGPVCTSEDEAIAAWNRRALAAPATDRPVGEEEGKLVATARRNIRTFIRSATFKSENDREADLACVDELEEHMDGLSDLVAVLRSAFAASSALATPARTDDGYATPDRTKAEAWDICEGIVRAKGYAGLLEVLEFIAPK